MIIKYKNKEIKEIKNDNIDFLNDLRYAADCHKKIRKEINKYIKPNIKYIDICNFVDKKINQIMDNNNLDLGIAFPVGISVNNIVAHDSAYLLDDRIITKNDIVKLDLGIHKNGYIIDSAYSFSFNKHLYKPLIEATKEATFNAIKLLSPDMLITEISENIKETINSYEIELNNKIYKINPVKGIGGHNIKKYNIHGGQIILCDNDSYPDIYKNQRVLENEIYAIETFASTGLGDLIQSNIPITHYMLNKNINIKNYKFKFSSTNKIYNWIIKNRLTLSFNSTWINKFYENKNENIKVSVGINELMKNDIITGYPPLEDKKNTFTSQCEHTIYLHDYGKEVLSYSDDY